MYIFIHNLPEKIACANVAQYVRGTPHRKVEKRNIAMLTCNLGMMRNIPAGRMDITNESKKNQGA